MNERSNETMNDSEPGPGMLHPEASGAEDQLDAGIRPRFLADFLGQKELKDNLSIFITAPGAGENHPGQHHGERTRLGN